VLDFQGIRQLALVPVARLGEKQQQRARASVSPRSRTRESNRLRILRAAVESSIVKAASRSAFDRDICIAIYYVCSYTYIYSSLLINGAHPPESRKGKIFALRE
jgi:hypothetical protein